MLWPVVAGEVVQPPCASYAHCFPRTINITRVAMTRAIVTPLSHTDVYKFDLQPVAATLTKNVFLWLGLDHNFHVVPSGKFLSETQMVVADTWLGGYSRPRALAPCRSLLVVAVCGRRCPRRARADVARCSTRWLGLPLGPLSPSRACGPSGTLSPPSAGIFPIFLWPLAGCLAVVVRCTARGHARPGIQSLVL